MHTVDGKFQNNVKGLVMTGICMFLTFSWSAAFLAMQKPTLKFRFDVRVRLPPADWHTTDDLTVIVLMSQCVHF